MIKYFNLCICVLFITVTAVAAAPVKDWINIPLETSQGSSDYISDMVKDSAENIIIVGYQTPAYDIFLAKYDTVGNELWRASYDSGGSDYMAKVAFDSTDNIYVAYAINDSDYGILRYNSAGTLQWATSYDSGAQDRVQAIVVDSSGNVFVTGESSTVKYDSNGNFLWGKPYEGWIMALDSAENIVISTHIDVGTRDTQTRKLDTDGNVLWVATYDSGGSDWVTDIALDGSDNIYITEQGNGNYNTIKYDTNGNQLWVGVYDGGLYDFPTALTVDTFENVYVTGISDNPTGDGAFLTVKYDSNGSQLWASRFDGASNRFDGNYGYLLNDYAYDLSLDSSGNVYVVGYSFVPNTGKMHKGNQHKGNQNECSTIKYDNNGNKKWDTRYDKGDNDVCRHIEVDSYNNVFIGGITLSGATHIQITKYRQPGKK